MSISNRRVFKRPIEKLNYKKLFLIITENSKIKSQYFQMLNNKHSIVIIKHIENTQKFIFEKLKTIINNTKLRKDDEVWFVIDKNHWTDEQINQFYKLSKENVLLVFKTYIIEEKANLEEIKETMQHILKNNKFHIKKGVKNGTSNNILSSR